MVRKVVYSHTGDVVRTVHLDNPTDLLGGGVFEIQQNADPLLAEVQHRRDVQEHEGHRADGMRCAALMPIAEYERAVREGWINDPIKMRAWLNAPENRDWRVWQGRA